MARIASIALAACFLMGRADRNPAPAAAFADQPAVTDAAGPIPSYAPGDPSLLSSGGPPAADAAAYREDIGTSHACDCDPWWHPRQWFSAPTQNWQPHPYSAGILAGPIWGEELEADRVDLGSGVISGVRFGRDFDEHFGWEGRLALATLGASSRVAPQPLPDADLFLADIRLLAYWEWSPRLHPFFSLGSGLALWDFADVDTARTETTLLFPLSLGVKYTHDPRMLLRLEVEDNISLAQRVGNDTVHTVALNFGFEYRFGGPRLSYDSWAR